MTSEPPSGSSTSADPPPISVESALGLSGQQQHQLAHLSEYVPLPRVADHEVNSKSANSLNVDGLARRKNTSFKITNILSSGPAGNDPDESGEDDPDDSRTEDISDNVEDILFMRAPIGVRRGSIPIELTATLFPMAELATFVGGNSGASTPGQGPVHGPRDRFKVVKIETAAPHRRGRWTCVQYADKNMSALAAQQNVSSNVSTVTTTTIVTTHSTGVDVNPGFSALNHEEPCLQNAEPSDPTPRIMSPTVQSKVLDDYEQKIISVTYQSGASTQVTQTGTSYSTSPIPFSSQGQSTAAGVTTFQVSTSQVSNSQIPIYSPVSMAMVSASQNIQPSVTMSQSQPSNIQVPQQGMHHQTMQNPHQGLIQQQQLPSQSQSVSLPQSGITSQSIPIVSQSIVIPQQMSQNMPPPIQQQASVKSTQGIQMQPQTVTVSQSGVMPQQGMFPQQLMGTQGPTLNQPIVIQQQHQPQTMTMAQQTVTSQTSSLPQSMVMSQGVALPQSHPMPVTQTVMSSQTMSGGQPVPMSQPSPMVQPVVICQIPSSHVISSTVFSMATTSDIVVSTSSQYSVPSSSSTIHKYDPVTSTAIHGGSGLQSPSSSQIPNTATVSSMFGGVYSSSQQQQSPVQQSQFQQIPHSQYQPMHQQSTYPSSQSIISSQSNLQQQQQSMQQIPQQQNQMTQQSSLLATSQTSMATHQPMIETQGQVVMQQNSCANTSATSVVTSQATQTLPMAATDRNAIYMAPVSRPVPTGQQSGATQAYLSVLSPIVLPSNSTSTVNSMPPSRDPVSGVLAHTPIINPAARDPSYVATQATFPDSQPVASDLLVERLEEISTQQELVEDPESTEVHLLSTRCHYSGLPERTNQGQLEFPCGHANVATQRRLSNIQAPGSCLYNSLTTSPVSPPSTLAPSSINVVGAAGFSPIRDSPKSLMDLVCSASGSNQGAIDNRIEQAMDLVKSHLMNAVRSEVDELKERIVKLEEIIAQLQSENEFFRANVHRDVLLQLQQQQQGLGSPASQQALQMIQQPGNQQQPPQI